MLKNMVVTLAAVLLLAGPAPATSAKARYVPAAGCPAEPLGLVEDVARRRPNEAGYPVCVDHDRLLDGALEEARREGKVVLASFGAPWCPQCRALMADLAAIRSGPVGAALMRQVVLVHLSTSATVGGRRVPVPSGEAALARFTGAAEAEPLRAIPYVVVVSPVTSRIVGRNLPSLQSGRAESARDELAQSLSRAIDHVTSGVPPPAAPTWLGRQLRRLGL